MNSFFRAFFASLLALIAFFAIILMLMFAAVATISSQKKVETGKNAVLLLDLSRHFPEIEPADPFAMLTGDGNLTPHSLYHVTQMIRHAATDESVKGILIKCDQNNNDFGASQEIRRALAKFQESKKFIIAYGNTIPQRAYFVASMANRVYCAPNGGLQWHGFSMTLPFLKGTLEKMEIEPQIFYAGKFKSATEPFRETEMTDANRLQTRELLSDLYGHFLNEVAASRKIDTATLHSYADSNTVQFASAALAHKMVDGLKYDDEVKDEIRQRLEIEKNKKINFVTLSKYAEAVEFMPSGGNRIGVIYAEGNIHDGKGEREQIGGETYKNLIRKARNDESIKAIVLRVNSGGGSAVGSEMIWREIELAKKVKPVIVSLGDVAASGGYYIACGADSIFAEPNTITGSIGVFSILPNMQKFFNNKLGVTFDEVKTSPDAGYITVTRPLNESQKRYFQNSIDTVYHQFKTRVANGRKRSMEYIDSIAQGRVWSGTRAVELGLVDRLGGLDEAIIAAAARAKLKDYRLREYPDKPGLLEMLRGESESSKESEIRNHLGKEAYHIYTTVRDLDRIAGTAQARMPFELIIE